MRLKNLVGKMAIRTAETIGETNTCVPFSFGFTQPLFPFEAGSPRKYMDKPVKIVAVEESQVVIERDGKRELLERKYVDEHWTDYERLLHPEEEEKEKAEKLMKEFEVAAEPIKRFLAEHYDPMCTAVISMDNIQIFRGELGEPIQNICCRCGAEVEEEMKG